MRDAGGVIPNIKSLYTFIESAIHWLLCTQIMLSIFVSPQIKTFLNVYHFTNLGLFLINIHTSYLCKFTCYVYITKKDCKSHIEITIWRRPMSMTHLHTSPQCEWMLYVFEHHVIHWSHWSALPVTVIKVKTIVSNLSKH